MTFRALSFATALLIAQPSAAVEFETLIEEQFQAEIGAMIPENGSLSLRFSPSIQDAVSLRAFWMNPNTGEFVADAFLDDGSVQRVSGFAMIMLKVPVPARQMHPGEIITPDDILEIEIAARRLNAFAITSSAKLEGMEVRRLLVEGKPVMTQSVIPPRLVERGDTVKIIFSDHGLSLSSVGRALADAALGDSVKVVNLSSNKSVVGVAKADGIVEVFQ